jgi:hypothetical protein
VFALLAPSASAYVFVRRKEPFAVQKLVSPHKEFDVDESNDGGGLGTGRYKDLYHLYNPAPYY